jgi:hypothetical protein
MPRPRGLPKTGGRKLGSKNRRTVQLGKIAEKATAGGVTPLEYMLAIMRDESADPLRRDDMARAAAPFIHPRRAPEDKQGNTVPPALYITNLPEDD